MSRHNCKIGAILGGSATPTDPAAAPIVRLGTGLRSTSVNGTEHVPPHSSDKRSLTVGPVIGPETRPPELELSHEAADGSDEDRYDPDRDDREGELLRADRNRRDAQERQREAGEEQPVAPHECAVRAMRPDPFHGLVKLTAAHGA